MTGREDGFMLIANVIFEAFHAAYWSWLFLAPLALLIVLVEAAILWGFNRAASPWAVLLCALGMNLASWLVGFLSSPMLFVDSGLVVVDPDEHGHGMLKQGPAWPRLALYSFLQAGIVSAVVEVAALLPFRRLARLRQIVLPVVLCNVVSYSVLFLGFVLMFGGWSYYFGPGAR
jgi:hypothetical protein